MQIGHFGQPGATAINQTAEAELFWGGDASRIYRLYDDMALSNALADAANTPTTVVRPGLLLGRLTADNRGKQWDPTNSDGTQDLVGVLPFEIVAVDQFGTAVERFAPVIVRAPLKASELKILGAALVGHSYEYLARRALWELGCVLDDDKMGTKAGMRSRIQTKATSYTVVAADNGTTFHAITADATFTLPTIQAGLHFKFIRMSDHELVVASAAGDDIVVGNDLSADSITFTTASEQIGAMVEVKAEYVNGTLKWIATLPQAPFGTAAGSAMTIGLAT